MLATLKDMLNNIRIHIDIKISHINLYISFRFLKKTGEWQSVGLHTFLSEGLFHYIVFFGYFHDLVSHSKVLFARAKCGRPQVA